MQLNEKNLTCDSDWLTTAQVAKLTQTSQNFWEKLRVRGYGPKYSRVGNRPRYRRADLEQWLENRSARSTAERGAK
ncbi:MAG: helix-turn-helix domain-containing protein [Sphingomonadaceae bacterium]|jgi:hypothetical protein|nr:helix-turn-helix domain-containing protein [Sphingomonadaceae bacterium]